MPLTRRDKLFCDEYIIDWNGPRAARAVGVPAEKAEAVAFTYLRREEIVMEIQRLSQATLDKHKVTQEMVLEQYAKIAFADRRLLQDDNGRVKNLADLPDELGACVEGFAITKGGFEVKMASKLPALQKLGEALNVFKMHEENKKANYTIIIDGKEAEL